jgi:hypothetical protein
MRAMFLRVVAWVGRTILLIADPLFAQVLKIAILAEKFAPPDKRWYVDVILTVSDVTQRSSMLSISAAHCLVTTCPAHALLLMLLRAVQCREYRRVYFFVSRVFFFRRCTLARLFITTFAALPLLISLLYARRLVHS